jgi:prepilin-type processing-associated H-X9-DG protein
MPIPFTCPHCGFQTSVSDQYAGQTGPCSQCGKTITVPGVVGTGYSAPAKGSSTSLVVLIVVAVVAIPVLVACAGILIALLLPAIQSAREAARRAQCSNNLRQIGLAMHNYHQAYRCFPPAFVPDENGRPKHSWRVLLLPYMEEDLLYREYDFNEPWDGPHNRTLASRMPAIFRCPSDSGGNPSQTDYAMIVGPSAISDGPTARKIGEITDGTSNTILIVEASKSGINWMEPRDVNVSAIGAGINPRGGGEGISSGHPGVVNVLFADGSVRSLPASLDPQTLDAAITIDGGEPVRIP